MKHHDASQWVEIYGIFQSWLTHIEHENTCAQQRTLAQRAAIDANIDQLRTLLDKLKQIEEQVINVQRYKNT